MGFRKRINHLINSKIIFNHNLTKKNGKRKNNRSAKHPYHNQQ